MARPRKDQADPAEHRLKHAFWTLLEEHDLHDITVGMMTECARCNRGTFYYHYDSFDALVDSILKEELLQELPFALFCILCQNRNPLENGRFLQYAKRLGLMIDRIGQKHIDTEMKTMITGIWQTILCRNGEPLPLDVRLIIEYASSGMIGIIYYLYQQDMLDYQHIPSKALSILQENTRNLIERVSQEQDIAPDELQERICRYTQQASMRAHPEQRASLQARAHALPR